MHALLAIIFGFRGNEHPRVKKGPDKLAIRYILAVRSSMPALILPDVAEGSVVDVAAIAFVGVDVHGEA